MTSTPPPPPSSTSATTAEDPADHDGDDDLPAAPAALGSGLLVLAVVAAGVAGSIVVAPGQYGLLVLVAAVALVAVVLGLASPALATAYLLVSAFLRLALPSGPLPTDAFILAFAGLVAALALRRLRGERSQPVGRLGPLVAAYVAWVVFSAVSAHVYDPVFPVDGTAIDVPRFVLVGSVMPLVLLLVGIAVLSSPWAIETLVRTTVVVTGYSALVTLLQFHGPAALVWPSYAAGSESWPGRAIGVVDQPAVHGLLLTVGYVVALMVASQPARARTVRIAAALLALACAYSVYLTFTRAAWLGLAVVVLLGAVLARGWRTGFVLTALAGVVGAAVNFSTLAGTDRSSGGVGSVNEIDDRLNINTTGLWATLQEPLTGWGIARFGAVNTYHHRQFSTEVPWERGYGLAAHNDLLAVSSELGLIGAGLWLAILVVVVVRLARGVLAARRDPSAGADDRFLVVALCALAAWAVSGLVVDQRFFDVTNLLVMVVVGAAIGRAERRAPLRVRARGAVGPAASGAAG